MVLYIFCGFLWVVMVFLGFLGFMGCYGVLWVCRENEVATTLQYYISLHLLMQLGLHLNT